MLRAEEPIILARPHGRMRRAIELVVAVTMLVLFVPLLLVIAVVVGTTSQGPVLYRQQRVGIGGRTFEILKFRTMRADADVLAEQLFAARNDGSGPLTKVHDDPRVTAVGRWLRRTSLDELPQLWNVVNGSMALVGPRPSTPVEVARFTPRDHLRHAVRPGITGITQVSGRSDLRWEDAVLLDLEYIEHRSVWLDLRILVRTVPAVLRARGAY
ncbi:sugar transferase [Nocardioides stalactiti]|uniref:sugar transferase n=1 Tax=Nocardioides stalactiti TaxID=2755356 RepID=UPI001603DF73|nr:sugar transferase [Nocardioides stalactiti]